MEEKLIYQKIANILKETKAITKSENNRQQGFKFRGIDNVMNELHELFAKNDVFILQEVQDFTVDARPTAKGGTLFYTRAKIKFRYTTTDGSFVETVNVGEAMDSGDKGMNKAMSIALKYSLLQMFLIPTEEQKDPDATTPEETDYFAMAEQEVNAAQTVETLQSIWQNYTVLQGDRRFIDIVNKKKNSLKNGFN